MKKCISFVKIAKLHVYNINIKTSIKGPFTFLDVIMMSKSLLGHLKKHLFLQN